MSSNLFNASLADVNRDISLGLIECTRRGLMHSSKFLAELKHGLQMPASFKPVPQQPTAIPDAEVDNYDLARSYYDLREYDRAAYFVRNCESPVPRFLHLYSTYMAKEKRRLDNMTDMANLAESEQFKDLTDLLATLKSLHAQRKLDGYCLYLYGIVLKKLDLKDLAVPVLVESLHAAPLLWSSWLELMPLIANKEQLVTLNLPNHWMKTVFVAHAHIELFLNDEGLGLLEQLQNTGFKHCTNITAQIAIAYHNKRS